MPLTTTVKILELADAKIAAMTADSDTAPTYGTSVDVPGVMKIGVAPKMENKKLYGDNKLLDIWSKVTEVELDVECAQLSLDAMKVIMGGTVTAGGTTPNQTQTYSLKGTDPSPGYFKIEGQWLYADTGVGDVHIVLYKVKVTDPPSYEVQGADGNFGTVKLKGTAIPCNSNNSWYDLVINETAAPIA